MTSFHIDSNGFYGKFGGAFVPDVLQPNIQALQEAYLPIIESEDFQREFHELLRDYVGRPSPLYFARRLSEKYGAKIYLKREDLNHTGAHKINNALGQILLAKRMGKKRIIAETGAGQHGVATATACGQMGMECSIYMGAIDVERQHVNVERSSACREWYQNLERRRKRSLNGMVRMPRRHLLSHRFCSGSSSLSRHGSTPSKYH